MYPCYLAKTFTNRIPRTTELLIKVFLNRNYTLENERIPAAVIPSWFSPFSLTLQEVNLNPSL